MEQLLAAISERRGSTPRCAAEADYHQLWLRDLGAAEDRHANAVLGGVLADRLAWVFIAGYQQAIRQCFDLSVAGWLAYCASEDRTGKLPGVTVSDTKNGRILNGNKTWVAAVEHLDALVVAVGRSPTQHFLVDADAPGLRLSARTTPGFLPDLSQGFAEFTGVQVGADLTRAPGPPFHILEAVAIYSAFCGFVLANCSSIKTQRMMSIIVQAADLWGRRLNGETVAGLKALDQQLQTLAAELDESVQREIPRWVEDRRLISMYSKGIQSLDD